MRVRIFLLFVLFYVFLSDEVVHAQSLSSSLLPAAESSSLSKEGLSLAERLSLARSFVRELKQGLDDANKVLVKNSGGAIAQNSLPDGEMLLLQPVIGQNIRVEAIIVGRVNKQKIEVSFADFVSALDLAVDVDPVSGQASGWYVREDQKIVLDITNGFVRTASGEFDISSNVVIEDGDLWVPVDELRQWLDFDINIDVSVQEIKVKSKIPLPLVAKLGRRKGRGTGVYEVPDVSLPFGGQDYTMASAPVVDVSTTSTYRKRGLSDQSEVRHAANIRAVGDLAKGTVSGQFQLNDEDRLTNARVAYKQESLEPDLLGPLKARKFEVGDVSGVQMPLSQFSGYELGARVTNTDPTKSFSSPFTTISGVAIPGWDVELYRNTQLLEVQTIGDDGVYQFSDVSLFLNDNNFRLVFYGPQGEIREKNVFVPVDRSLLSQNDGIYDVSVTLDNKNTYRKRSSNDEDAGSINIAALYEKPLPGGVTALAGVRSFEDDSERNTVGLVGMSSVINQTLVNANLAVDDEGDMASNLVLRRNFNEHEVRNTLNWTMGGFDNPSQNFGTANVISTLDPLDSYSNNFQINGPVYKGEQLNLQYSAASDYSWTDNGDYDLLSTAGLNMRLRGMNVNGNLRHFTGSNVDDSILDSTLNVSGRVLGNRVRLAANYDIKPESQLESVTGTINRRLHKDLDIEVGATKRPQTGLTEYQARLDWQAGFIRISPSVRYNSENDFFAGLNTRFGVFKDPSTDSLKMYDENVSYSGMLSAFVFLDRDGNGEFDEGDEPLPDVIVRTPQSGRRVATDENGVALFNRLRVLNLTDVFLDKDTLQDPVWVPGFEGVSILPREGYVAQIDFPVHMSGELDGTLYAGAIESEPVALKNVGLLLYNDKGEIENSTTTDTTGFYYFTQIPPGRYLLTIDEKDAQRLNIVRPVPAPIEIGYEGTVIYNNTITVKTGEGDVPSEILSDLDDYKNLHPDIDFSQDYDLVLNLGEYNSRLMMSVVWYKLRSRYASMLQGGDLFVPPTQSHADVESGKHILRVGLKGETVEGAYSRCRALMVRDQYCKVEIFPALMQYAKGDVPADAIEHSEMP